MPANAPTDPTMANAKRPLVKAPDGDDDDGGEIDGDGGKGCCGVGGGDEIGGKQGLQIFPLPEQSF